MMGPAIDVTVNRNYIYQDAFDQLTEDKGEKNSALLNTINFLLSFQPLTMFVFLFFYLFRYVLFPFNTITASC